MKNDKLVSVIEGLIIVVLGILIAVVGIGNTVDLYFGVLFTAIGGILALFVLYLLSQKKELPLGITLMSGVSLAIGIALFTHYLSFAMLVNILVMVVLGFGSALIFYGIYFAVKKSVSYGVLTIVIGAATVTLVALYLNIPDFAKAFWIIVGILVAIYGALVIVFSLMDKKGKKK